MPSTFKPGLLAKIAKLWAEGATTPAIGRCLNMPKNTVCGMVFAARKEGDMRFPKREFKRPDKPSPAPQIKRPPQAVPEAPEARPRGVPFVEVWADGCRFEMGAPGRVRDFQFCNARTEMGVWCADHWPRVYNFTGLRAARFKNGLSEKGLNR